MINRIDIKNFKALRDVSLELSNFNLFSGTNSSGKSSVLQALLLLRQSYMKGYLSNQIKKPSLFLGDEDSLVRLGIFRDVFHDNAPENEEISISLSDKQIAYGFLSNPYEYKIWPSNYSQKDSSEISGSLVSDLSLWQNVTLFTDGFQYLTADRLEVNDFFPNSNRNGRFLGKKGEFTPYFLDELGNVPIPISALMHDKTQNSEQDTLGWQVNYWMKEISQNITIHTKRNLALNSTELWYNYTYKGIAGKDRKPQNVGYGITPSLPIVVAILMAKPDDLILIENPETHLHPAAQSALAQLMARAAQNGVQLIIETHSDHFINGTLVATKRFENGGKGIDKDKVKIYHFKQDEKQQSRAIHIPVLEDGRIKIQPEDFFEQTEKDLTEIMEF